MDKPESLGKAQNSIEVGDLISGFIQIETLIRKKVEDLIILKYKQCKIVQEIYEKFGTQGLKELSIKTGYNYNYLYDYITIAKAFKDEEELLNTIKEKNIKTFRELIDYTEVKLKIPQPIRILNRIEKNLDIIERKVVQTDELIKNNLTSPEVEETFKIVKNEFLEFKNKILSSYFDILIQILYEIKKLDINILTNKEKIILFDKIKNLLDKIDL